jgi:hypothetical protein
VREHCAQEWASALLVASIVTIANLHFHWLRAFDTYTFLTLGQLTSVSLAGGGKEYRTLVVEIDDATFESELEERTPLDRQHLTRYLAAIYDAEPDIVVVDLDLSPALQPIEAWVSEHGKCVGHPQFPELKSSDEKALYKLIKERAAGPKPITTVLLAPFDTRNEDLACWRQSWKGWMEGPTRDGPIVFGNGEVPVRYGVHAELSQNERALVRIAERRASGESVASAERSGPRRLDPRQLLKGVGLIPLSSVASADPAAAAKALSDRVRFELADLDSHERDSDKNSPPRKKVVFFGGAYGVDDLFLTAVGEIYGVVANAAGYASDMVEDHHVIDFLLDFLIALAFSLAIAFFWRRYFDARLSENAVTRELAKVWIIGLVLSVLFLVLILSFGSLLLLRTGVWLSPIPLAIGMLFDSFVSGSVDQATHKFKVMRRELIEQFAQQTTAVDALVDHSVSLSVDPATQEVTIREVCEELVESRTPETAVLPAHKTRRRVPRNHKLASWGARYLPRVLGGDICEHLLARKNGAAALLGLWTIIWVSTAVWASCLAWTVH